MALKRDQINDEIIMTYLMGTMSPEEMSAIDQWRTEDPALEQAIISMEIGLEQFAFDQSLSKPPIDLPTGSSRPDHPVGRTPESSKWKCLLISLVTAMVGAALVYSFLQPRHQELREELKESRTSYATLEDRVDEVETQLSFYQHESTDVYTIASDDAKVVVYWNDALQNARLRNIQLPTLDDSETYQIWADVDGEMLDLGIFDERAAKLQDIPIAYLEGAESLNITIEPAGGSTTPTVSRLVANTYM